MNAQQTLGLRLCPLVLCVFFHLPLQSPAAATLVATAGSTSVRFFFGCEWLTGAQEEIERVPTSLNSRQAGGEESRERGRGSQRQPQRRPCRMRKRHSSHVRHAHNCLESQTAHRHKTRRESHGDKQAYLTQLTTLNGVLFLRTRTHRLAAKTR